MFVSLVPGVLHHKASGNDSSTLVTRRSSDGNKNTKQSRKPLSSDKGLKHLEVRPEVSSTREGLDFTRLLRSFISGVGERV